MDLEAYAQAIISLLVITAPFDPVKILFFNQAIADPPQRRTWAAARVALYVTCVLGGAALAGREVLDLLGIDLNAFSTVGGLVIAGMGFEMLYGGGASQAQGGKERQEGPAEGNALLIPLTIPLIAGPGAITTTITLSSRSEGFDAVLGALVGVGAVAAAAFIAFAWLGGALSRVKPTALSVMVRIGGLLLATIGVQMILNGLKNFFA